MRIVSNLERLERASLFKVTKQDRSDLSKSFSKLLDKIQEQKNLELNERLRLLYLRAINK